MKKAVAKPATALGRKPVEPPMAVERGRRDEILDAAVSTVLAQGYARTTMSQVARAAGVPRPLVQYYFATRETLLQAAIDKISSDWRDSYFSELYGDHAGDTIGISEGIDRLWVHMHQPLFKAYQELLFSAQTDPALAETMRAAQHESERRRREEGAKTYAAYVNADAQAYVDTSEFTAIFLEGLLWHEFRHPGETAGVARQLALLKHMLAGYWHSHGMDVGATEAVAAGDEGRRAVAALARRLIAQLAPLADAGEEMN